MEDQNLHYRHVVLFYFKKGKNASQAWNRVCSGYGKDVVSLHISQKMIWKIFDRDFCRLNIRHASAAQSRLIRVKLRCYWTKIQKWHEWRKKKNWPYITDFYKTTFRILFTINFRYEWWLSFQPSIIKLQLFQGISNILQNDTVG